MRSLTPKELAGILEELAFQDRLEQYGQAYHFAFLASIIASTQGRKRFKPEDFIGKPPVRNEKAARSMLGLAALIEDAKMKGLKVPSLRRLPGD